MIDKGDIAAIKSEDDHPCYLLKLMKDPFEVETVLKDDYNHVFPPCHRVVVGNYPKLIKQPKTLISATLTGRGKLSFLHLV